MSKSILEAKVLQDEAAAYAWVEARIWPDGPVCPHCGGTDRISKMGGKSTRIGAYKCYQCRQKFTVKIGTVFEDSHVPMRLWLQAIYLICSSKKGVSSNQLHRTLGVTIKTAWFMAHRIREAMRDGGLAVPFGSDGGYVEVDETFIGRDPDARPTPRLLIHLGLRKIRFSRLWIAIVGKRAALLSTHYLPKMFGQSFGRTLPRKRAC